jgi:hypothetical protein
MERRLRRYVPGSEGLEGRRLLSSAQLIAAPPADVASITSTSTDQAMTATATGTSTPRVATAAQQPQQQRQGPASRPLTPAQEEARQELIQTRLQRIDRLPDFLQLLDPGRPLPEPAMATIQQELRGFVAQLRPPAGAVAEGFIGVLRDAISQASVNPQTVAALNAGTAALLRSAGASEQSVEAITDSMTDLARSAAQSRQPVVVLTNDYALVLQTALGVGRPISRFDLLAATGAATPFNAAPNGLSPAPGVSTFGR